MGAQQCKEDNCKWHFLLQNWGIIIHINQHELKVVWHENGKNSQCSFSYGLSRADVEAAINDGPLKEFFEL